jgi:hypothetical protein
MFMLAQRIESFASQHGLGIAMPEGLGFVLRRDPDLVREPDVSFITATSVPDEGLPKEFWEGAPTLAVEVVSPNDRASDIHDRVQDYLDAGSLQVWGSGPARAPFRSIAPMPTRGSSVLMKSSTAATCCPVSAFGSATCSILGSDQDRLTADVQGQSVFVTHVSGSKLG